MFFPSLPGRCVALGTLVLLLSGCGASAAEDGGVDASVAPDLGPAPECSEDADCDDGDACNGEETCADDVCASGDPADPGAACTLPDDEPGVCDGAGACVEPGCGNGIVDGDEACDDGRNGDDEDGCTDECELSCTTDEDCDDGDVCTGTRTCDTEAGICSEPIDPLECEDDNDCTADACDPVDGCTFTLIDGDSDGQASVDLGECGTDCDDTRDFIFDGADEVCDTFDNDCDGLTDEDLLIGFFVDCDADGFAASMDGMVSACAIPAPPTALCGDAPAPTWTMTAPVDDLTTDCDDTLAAASPAGVEPMECNGIDEDCSGVADDTVSPELSLSVIGRGRVTSDPAAVDCAADCTVALACFDEVTLSATPEEGARFDGFTGDCTDAESCDLVFDDDRAVTASFVDVFDLEVSLLGSGEGRITSSPVGIDCGTDCAETFDDGTVVTLTQAEIGDSVFQGWGGDCASAGTADTCMVTLDQDLDVTATYAGTFLVEVDIVGGGDVGRRDGFTFPPRIECNGPTTTCSEDVPDGDEVTLVASPEFFPAVTVFSSWTAGPCMGSTDQVCTFTVDGDTTVEATFVAAPANTLVLRIGGNATTGARATATCGTETCVAKGNRLSHEGPIACSITCSPGDTVDLCCSNGGNSPSSCVNDGQLPSSGRSFDGWDLDGFDSGGTCTGRVRTCTVSTGTTVATAECEFTD